MTITSIKLPTFLSLFHRMHTCIFNKFQERLTETLSSKSKTFHPYLWILHGDQLTYYSVQPASKTRPILLTSHLSTGWIQNIILICFRSTNTQIQIKGFASSLAKFRAETISIMTVALEIAVRFFGLDHFAVFFRGKTEMSGQLDLRLKSVPEDWMEYCHPQNVAATSMGSGRLFVFFLDINVFCWIQEPGGSEH